MSNFFKKRTFGFTCDDEASWQRLANPLSFLLRNSALFAIVIILWWRNTLGWWTLFVVAVLIGVMFLSVRVPRARSAFGWHHEAIMGERWLVCHGWQNAPTVFKQRLIVLKIFDIVAFLALTYGLVLFKDKGVASAILLLLLVRILLLDCTRSIYRSVRGKYDL